MRRLAARIRALTRRVLRRAGPSFHLELQRALQAQQPVALRAGTLQRALEQRNANPCAPGGSRRTH